MLLQAEQISRCFFRNGRDTNLLRAVAPTDFSLPAGRFVEIVGRSGSGKSTFANMLAGLLRPTEGRVLFRGADLYALGDAELARTRNRGIGVVPQGQSGLPRLTVLENVLAPAAMYGEAAGAAERALELLEDCGIAPLRDVYAGELSGGELRRVAIARALVNAPALLIADEPTGDLDDETTERVLRLLRRSADGGMGVLMVTHDREAAAWADAVYRMDGGVLSPA